MTFNNEFSVQSWTHKISSLVPILILHIENLISKYSILVPDFNLNYERKSDFLGILPVFIQFIFGLWSKFGLSGSCCSNPVICSSGVQIFPSVNKVERFSLLKTRVIFTDFLFRSYFFIIILYYIRVFHE